MDLKAALDRMGAMQSRRELVMLYIAVLKHGGTIESCFQANNEHWVLRVVFPKPVNITTIVGSRSGKGITITLEPRQTDIEYDWILE